MLHIRLIFAAVAIASLSACLLDSDLERGIAGAAAGAVVANALGGDAVTGAIAGGAAGALCDEVTRICQ
jgi:osmotically inducible lipoprotein OsmB